MSLSALEARFGHVRILAPIGEYMRFLLAGERGVVGYALDPAGSPV